MPFTPASQVIKKNQPPAKTGFTPASDILIQKYESGKKQAAGNQASENNVNPLASPIGSVNGLDLAKSFINTFKEGGKNVTQDISNSKNIANEVDASNINLPQGEQYQGKNSLGAKILATAATAGHVAGDVAETAGGLLGDALAPLIPQSLKEGIGGVVHKINDKISQIPGMTPEIHKSIGDVVNTALLEGGVKAEAPVKAGIEAGAEATGNTLEKGAQVVKNTIEDVKATRTAKKAVTSFDSSVQDVMPLQNKNVRIDELRNALPDSKKGTGGVTRKGLLGKSAPQATPKDLEVAQTAHPYISVTRDPLKKIQNVNKGISDISSKTNGFLDANPTKANFEDMKTYMDRNKPTQSLQKDPGASEAYKNSTENALNTLASTLKKSTNPEVSGAEIRQARIKIDQQIAKELGETTFDSPQYKGIKAAEVDTRNMLNRMNEDMLRYPGQLDKVNRMNEFIDAAKGRGIEVDMNNPEVRETIEKQFNLEKTPESESAAKNLSDSHKTMSNLYQARDNMIDKYQSKVGGNKVKEWAKNNPTKAKILLYGGGTLVTDKVLKILTGGEVGF